MYKKFTNKLGWPPHRLRQCLLVMKLTTLLLFMAIMQVSATSFAQKVTLNQQHITIAGIFKEIRKQTGYNVIWEPEKLNEHALIDVQFNKADLTDVLSRCLYGTNLEYKIEDKTIVIKQKITYQKLFWFSQSKITGVVKTDKGEVLMGATVIIEKINKSALTDANGAFTIENVPNGNYELTVSYVGFEKFTTDITVDNQEAKIVVVMKPGTNVLDEAVVKGYYSTTRRLNTGDVTTVRAAAIANQPVDDPLLALEGLVTGLYIQQTSGMPGAKVNVQLRGINSFSSNSTPLYIIDGVPFNGNPVDEQNYDTGAISGQPNGTNDPLNLINPQDIERIEVLKDADATSIYGSRGANGVILITTKKGKEGKTNLSVNGYTGAGKVSRMLPTLNTSQYLSIRRQAFANDGITPTLSNAPDLVQWSPNDNTDYQKMLIGGTSHITSVNASLSGGDKLTTFLLSGTYNYQTTVQPGDSHDQRGSVNMKVNHVSPDGKLKVDLSTLYSTDNNLIYGPDFTGTSISYPNNYPLYQDGQLYWGGGFSNPLALLNEKFKFNTENLILNAVISYNILKNLQIKASIGQNKIELDQKLLYPGSSGNPAYQSTGVGAYTDNSTKTYIAEPQIDYNTVIARGKLNATIGGTWQHTKFDEPYFVLASGFASDALMDSYTSAANYYTQINTSSDYKYASLFGRLGYSWDEKYIINGTFRRDGSSRFGPGKRYGDFASLGAAWVFSDESVFKQLNWLSFGKLRASYGSVGNDPSSNYGYLNTYSPAFAPYGTNKAYVPSGVANPDYSWETTKKLEAALELGFLDNRLLINGTWFRNRTNSLLASYPLSQQSGFDSYTANLNALVQNAGFELEIRANPINKKDFTWNASFNISAYKNKLLSFPDLVNSSYASEYVIGQPLDIVPLYHFTGFKNGQATVEDVNHDGAISPGLAANGKGDYVIAGSREPSFFGGFTNSIRYKQFQLDILVNFVKQKNYTITSFPGLLNNQYRDVLSSQFTPSTQSSSASYNSYINYYIFSDAAYTDASFIRLKNLSLSYDFPDSWKRALKMSNCRIYVRGQNLITITKYKGFDPETTIYPGIPNVPYASPFSTPTMPSLRTFTAGIQFTY